MARTREFDPDQALEQALVLFWDRGFADTSMDDLVRATGVSRYGLYGAFGNKRELFIKALERYWEFLRVELFADLEQESAAMPEIVAFFGRMRAMAHSEVGRQGCMMCNAATEMAQQDPELGADVRELLGRGRLLVERAVANAVAEGQLPEGTSPEALSTAILAFGQGMAVLARAGFDLEQLQTGLDAVTALLGETPVTANR